MWKLIQQHTSNSGFFCPLTVFLLNSNPQSYGVGVKHCEVARSWRQSALNEVSVFMGDPRALPPTVMCICEKLITHTWKMVPARVWHCLLCDPRPPTSRVKGNKFQLFISCLDCGTWIQQPKQGKTYSLISLGAHFSKRYHLLISEDSCEG